MLGSDALYCPLRKKWVAACPEEKVRQALIDKMIHQLGYPMGNIAIEKDLAHLPHIKRHVRLPKRRADLLVLAKGIHPEHPMYPLLLIECKAVPLTEKTLRQIIGYNQFIAAPFLAVVNSTQTLLGWYSPAEEDFVFQEGLLPYTALLGAVSTR